MVLKNGDWKQVGRVWGGYFFKSCRIASGLLVRLLLAKPGQRDLARQLWLHLRVLIALAAWLPSLGRRRIQIQTKAKIHPYQLDTWFIE
jgi:hypothetical protein